MRVAIDRDGFLGAHNLSGRWFESSPAHELPPNAGRIERSATRCSSPKTLEDYLTYVVVKIGVATRAEVAEANGRAHEACGRHDRLRLPHSCSRGR